MTTPKTQQTPRTVGQQSFPSCLRFSVPVRNVLSAQLVGSTERLCIAGSSYKTVPEATPTKQAPHREVIVEATDEEEEKEEKEEEEKEEKQEEEDSAGLLWTKEG